eukprot:TRINITY_DN6723_c0_g1_i5.p1 TRINITY_DN6723_c0_g1~~TRINITY_DN6723_c0_g1_i5.p1  ORF type:complete len:231 (+),score=56.59 TRINITY_DN6723_c0_g1_i5:757-1449(+)
MLMSKNDVNVVCCGSGNIREVLEDSSSEIIVIADPYKFSPRVDFESFKSFFSLQADVQSPTVNLSDAEPMLSFSPKSVLDLYAGTNGHFLSLSILRVDLMQNLDVGEAWRSAIEHFQNCMSKFSPRVDLESFNSFFSLQADVQSPIVNLSDAEPMLSFSPKYVLDLYAGTNGYFSSLPILRVDLMPGLYVGEAWRSAIEHFQNCMSKFFRKKDGYKLGQALHLFCSKFAC